MPKLTLEQIDTGIASLEAVQDYLELLTNAGFKEQADDVVLANRVERLLEFSNLLVKARTKIDPVPTNKRINKRIADQQTNTLLRLIGVVAVLWQPMLC
jgi:hypothetical protein